MKVNILTLLCTLGVAGAAKLVAPVGHAGTSPATPTIHHGRDVLEAAHGEGQHHGGIFAVRELAVAGYECKERKCGFTGTFPGGVFARETAVAGFECKEPKCGFTGTFPGGVFAREATDVVEEEVKDNNVDGHKEAVAVKQDWICVKPHCGANTPLPGGVFARGLLPAHSSTSLDTVSGPTAYDVPKATATASSAAVTTGLIAPTSNSSSLVQAFAESYTYGGDYPSSAASASGSSILADSTITSASSNINSVSSPTSTFSEDEETTTSTSTLTITSSFTSTRTSTIPSATSAPYTNSSSLSTIASSLAEGVLSSKSAVWPTSASNSSTIPAPYNYLASPIYTISSAAPAVSPFVEHHQTVSSICAQSIVTITVTQSIATVFVSGSSSAVGAVNTHPTTSVTYHLSPIVSTSVITSTTISVSRSWSYTIETHVPHTELPGPATAPFSHFHNSTGTSTALGVVTSTGGAVPTLSRPPPPVFTGGADKKDAELFGGLALAVAFVGAALLI